MGTPPAPTYSSEDTSAGNRFAFYSNEDHSAPIWIATLLCMIYIVGTLLLRIFIKRHIFSWDDWLLCASSVIALAQSSVLYVAFGAGLGKTINHVAEIKYLGELVLASRILLIVALYLAKLSVLAILHRIFVRDQPHVEILSNVVSGFIVLSGLGAIITSSAGCPTSGLFTGPHCSVQVVRWSVVTALDIVTETVMLLLLPWLLWQVQMRLSMKIHVIVAFCCRISIIAFSILYLEAWRNYTNGPPSPLRISRIIVWQQILLAISLITATVPSLKAFLESLSTNWGDGEMTRYGTSNHTGAGTYELRNWSSSRHKKPATVNLSKAPGFETHIYTSARAAGGRNSQASSTDGSQDLIIRKETTWNVRSS